MTFRSKVCTKLKEYLVNYIAYVVCVIVVSILMGYKINYKQILLMSVVLVVAIELWNWGKHIISKFSKRQQ